MSQATTLPTVAAAAIRYAVATFGTFAVARGWVDPANVDGIATLVITAATVLYGLYRTAQIKKQAR